MGMDVYGINPQGVKGDYFRANVWYWRPLWAFICDSCSNILTLKDMERGCNNNGHTISKTKSKRIANRLRKFLKEGDVDAYESYYKRKVSQLAKDDWNRSYPFHADNVKQFERFCEHSGGFEIW